MTQSVTDRIQEGRLVVVSVDRPAGRVRVKGAAETCDDLACGEAVVAIEDGQEAGLDALNPGDIVRVQTPHPGATRIVVVRRVWDELTSPEF
jgi:hypothetical protein